MKKRKISKKKISIAGLGKLGLPLAACFASRGFKTIGIDIQENIVSAVNKGLSPIIEPELPELLSKCRYNLRATLDHQEAIEETDITSITVATPSDPRGNFSNRHIESALRLLSKPLEQSKKDYHLFIINSTVMPGSIEKRITPLIEKYSGRKLNVGFGVCYIPEFVALGSVIKDFLNPDLVIIGESDKFAGDQVVPIYKKFCKNKPHIARMPIISGEIAKVALNNYLTLKMSFANTLTNLCEKIPGADIDLITEALEADKRIAPRYLKGGLSFGGRCFPRDIKAYIALSKKYNSKAELVKIVEKINNFQDIHLAKIVFKNLSSAKKKKVSILGLSFKPNSSVITESPAIKLIYKLLKQGIEIAVYDPLAMDDTRNIFRDKIEYAKSVRDCLSRSSFWIITTPDKKFKNIDNSFVTDSHTIIIDCWRILDLHKFSKIKNVKCIRWGYFRND